MAAFIVLGDPVFTTVEARDEVAAAATRIAADAGLTPSRRVQGMSPGVTLYDYVDPWGTGTLPGVRIAFQGSNQQTVSDAANLMADVIYPLDPQAGSFGTWTDMSG